MEYQAGRRNVKLRASERAALPLQNEVDVQGQVARSVILVRIAGANSIAQIRQSCHDKASKSDSV